MRNTRVMPLPEYRVHKRIVLRSWLCRPHPTLRLLLLWFMLCVAAALLLTGCGTFQGATDDVSKGTRAISDFMGSYTRIGKDEEPRIVYMNRPMASEEVADVR